jgi:hypothetical protein
MNFQSRRQTDVKSPLGLAGYYRKFIPQFSKIAKPLNDRQKKYQVWKWGPDQIESYQQLKTALIKEPVLQYPDLTRPFILQMQADLQ